MTGMRRSDRRDVSDDNARRNIHIPQNEPTSDETLQERVLRARSELASTKLDRDNIQIERDNIQSELEEINQSLAEKSSELVHVLQAFQTSQQEVETWKQESNQNHQRYLLEQQNYQQTLALYDKEKSTSSDWLAKYEAAEAQSAKYIALYNESQTELKFERRSKASIKGWETRRKQENQRLKQEIGEMAALLRESLTREDKALENLYLFSDRMDKIQKLVDSVEGESSENPISFAQKIMLIMQTIKEILSK